MELVHVIAGIVAAILSLVGAAFYVRAVWKRTSTTRWSSWMIWTVTSTMSFATYWGSGARESAFVPMAYVLVCSSIFAVALWRRSPGGLSRIEVISLIGAVLTALIWWGSGSALFGQIASVTVEFIAYIPIWLAARDENRLAWILEASGSVVNLFAISAFTVGLLLYPAMLLICNSIVVILIVLQNRKPAPLTATPEKEKVLVAT